MVEGIQLGGLRRARHDLALPSLCAAVIQGTSTFEQLAEFVGPGFELLRFDHLTGIYLSTTEVTRLTGMGCLRLAVFMQHTDVVSFDAIRLPTDYLHNFSACTTRLRELGVHVGRKKQLYQVRAALLAAQDLVDHLVHGYLRTPLPPPLRPLRPLHDHHLLFFNGMPVPLRIVENIS